MERNGWKTELILVLVIYRGNVDIIIVVLGWVYADSSGSWSEESPAVAQGSTYSENTDGRRRG